VVDWVSLAAVPVFLWFPLPRVNVSGESGRRVSGSPASLHGVPTGLIDKLAEAALAKTENFLQQNEQMPILLFVGIAVE